MTPARAAAKVTKIEETGLETTGHVWCVEQTDWLRVYFKMVEKVVEICHEIDGVKMNLPDMQKKSGPSYYKRP